MYAHKFLDIVSLCIQLRDRWTECDISPTLCNAATNNEKSVYVDIGANIRSCVMGMLPGTDKNTIAFKMHTMYLFGLKTKLSQIDTAFQSRLCCYQ